MNENKTNSISVSLINRAIYSVCYPEIDTLAAFHGSLYTVRRRFFESGKSVRVRETGIYSGLTGELSGKLTKHSIKWKKQAAGHVLESLFTERKQHGIAFFEPGDILRCRVFLDEDHRWVRSEYFSPEDPLRSRISFKPDPTRDVIQRFDYNHTTGTTKQTDLFPVPYAFQTAEQSFQNAHFGDDVFLVSTDTGEFAYCPKAEQQKRLKFMESNKDASVMLTMGWEIKDGDLTSKRAEEKAEAAYDFKALDEPTEILNEQPTNDAPVEAVVSGEDLGLTDDELSRALDVLNRILSEHDTAPKAEAVEPTQTASTDKTEEAPVDTADNSTDEAVPTTDSSEITLIRSGRKMNYLGHTENGKREGMGRTENADGITIYEGEYKNDLRDGFGAHHYKSGAISYVGDFKEDLRDGFGVSFRESDHSLNVSQWKNGKPNGYSSLFDPSGKLLYAGKIVDGKKQGFGVSINTEKDTVFVSKYVDNEPTGEGAMFSGDGTLLYVGGWENGMRNGHGTEFDKDGDIIYSGEWKDDQYENGILYKKVHRTVKDGAN